MLQVPQGGVHLLASDLQSRTRHPRSQSVARAWRVTPLTTPSRAQTRDRAASGPRAATANPAGPRDHPCPRQTRLPCPPFRHPQFPPLPAAASARRRSPRRASGQAAAAAPPATGPARRPSAHSQLPPCPPRRAFAPPPSPAPPAQQPAASALVRVCCRSAVRATRVKPAPAPAQQPHAHTTPLTGSGTPARSTTGRAGAGLPKPNIPCAKRMATQPNPGA